MRRRSPLAALVALVALGVPAAAPAAVGSAGLGDPFFPLAGNGGYDVRHYAIALDYEPASRRLSGRTVVAATATQELDRFDLDLRSFSVVRVRVHHRAAAFARDGHELVVTPARRLRAGRRFVVSVRYAGTAQAVTDPDGSKEGWAPTSDGAFVVGEPQGAPSWFPANDDPRDKARFDVVVTVPRGNVVMGNGELRRRSDHGGRTTWWWHEGAPMATYLATASNGRFELLRSRGPDGLPILDAIDSGLPADERRRAAQALAREPEILRFLGGLYGPYPFETAGGIVDHAPDVGYALETQTRPSYDGAPAAVTIVHELSHQWVGDSVTPRTWPDIWLNEGFATYTEWLWSEHEGGRTAQQIFNAAYAREGFAWEPAAAALPGASFLFSRPPYDRGAMALHALPVKVGDPVFFRILRDWTAEHAYGTVRTADFTALAERDSGRDLTALFGAWLFRTGRPDSP